MGIAGDLAVLGAGGHAKVVIATAEAAGWRIIGVYDDDPGLHGTRLVGHRVLGPLDEYSGGPAVLAVGANAPRKHLADRVPGGWVSLVHPGAIVHPSARLGPGAVVFAGAVVQPATVVGAHAIINTAATVDHDGHVGDFAHIGPGVHLCGGVRVGEGTLVGVGACAIPLVQIGSWATVGAGAVVTKNVADRTRALGAPARSSS